MADCLANGCWPAARCYALDEARTKADIPARFGCPPHRLAMTFRIRDANNEDVPALAQLHVQRFNETHRGGCGAGPSYSWRERQWREAFTAGDKGWFCFVGEDAVGRLVGFAKGTVHDGGVPGFAGELNKINVLRGVHRRGIGRLLLCNVARRFIERGITSILLFGEATNPSNGFYEAFGAERLYSENGDFHGGYGWRDLGLLVSKSCSRELP